MFESEKFCKFTKENAKNINSLLIANSESKILSAINDFELAIEMINADNSLKKGPRISFE